MDHAVRIINAGIEEVLVQNDKLHRASEAKEYQIKLFEEKTSYFLHYHFDPKTEYFDDRQHSLLEDDSRYRPLESTVAIKVLAYPLSHSGRYIHPKDLLHVLAERELPEEEERFSCGNWLTWLEDEDFFQYEVTPVRFYVIRNTKFKYGYSYPQYHEFLKTAKQASFSLLPRTQISPSLPAWTGTRKFVDGLPLNRITTIVEECFGVPFADTTLANWMTKGAKCFFLRW